MFHFADHAREIRTDITTTCATGRFTIHTKDFAPTAIAHPKLGGIWITSYTARITKPTEIVYRPAPCTTPHNKHCYIATGQPKHSTPYVYCDRCEKDQHNFLFGYDEFTVTPLSPLPSPPPSPTQKPLPHLPRPELQRRNATKASLRLVDKDLPPPPPLSFRSRQAYDMVQRENNLKARLYRVNEFGC
ncbi:hypothetical protein Q8F55_005446 [Vanrija albida]|uniref:Uncharacterized protein n=1 Tax=Vanrija albida TaxID=181172 RepID=A0ABR3Q2P1_9TREE